MTWEPNAFMGLKPGDYFTAAAWNSLVEAVLTLAMRVEFLEQRLEAGEVRP